MKVVCALYADPVEGYPPKYARDSVPNVGLDTCPSDPWNQKSFKPGDLLGCKSGELGLRKWLEERGHTLVVTTDKYGCLHRLNGVLCGALCMALSLVTCTV